MLLHIDGSAHRWFQDERWYDLLVILDDANSEIYYAQLVEEEATRTVLAGLKEVVEHLRKIQSNQLPSSGIVSYRLHNLLHWWKVPLPHFQTIALGRRPKPFNHPDWLFGD